MIKYNGKLYFAENINRAFSFLIISSINITIQTRVLFYYYDKLSSKDKRKNKKREKDRFFVSISRRCSDRLITRNGRRGTRCRKWRRRGRVALSERRGEDLVIPKGIVERDSPVSSHHSDALYLLCHPFVIVLDERDASLAATDFLIDRGYFPHTHTFPFDCRTSWHTVGGLIWFNI